MDRRLGSRFAIEMKSSGIFAGRGCVKNMSRKIDDCDDRNAVDSLDDRLNEQKVAAGFLRAPSSF
jgi:hypothetical protein